MKIVTYKIRSYIKIVQSVSFDTNKLYIKHCEISMKFLAFIKQKQNNKTVKAKALSYGFYSYLFGRIEFQSNVTFPHFVHQVQNK